jgi:hypothetical protein
MMAVVSQSSPSPLWGGIKGGGEYQAPHSTLTPTLTPSPLWGGKPSPSLWKL